MENVYLTLGEVFCVIGGVCLISILIGFLASISCDIWGRALVKFGRIRKTSRLVHSYKHKGDYYNEY